MTAELLDPGSEEFRDALRHRVFERVAKRWNNIHHRGLLGAWFGCRRLKAILLAEVNDQDAKNESLAGDVIAAWQHDHEGLRQIEADCLDPGALYGHFYWGSIWEKQLWRFYIATDNDQVVIEEEDGPRRVWHSRHSVVTDKSPPSLNCFYGRMNDNSPMTFWNFVSSTFQWILGLLFIAALIAFLAFVAYVRHQRPEEPANSSVMHSVERISQVSSTEEAVL